MDCDTCSNPNVSFLSDDVLIVEATDQFGCRLYDSLQFTVWPLPQVIAPDDIVACRGEELTLSADTMDVFDFQWSDGLGINNTDLLNPIIEVIQDELYVISVTNNYGCIARDSVMILMINKVVSRIGSDTSICQGDSLRLIAEVSQASESGYQLIWTPVDAFADPTAAEQMIIPDSSGQYILTVYSSTCEADTQYITVNLFSNPVIDAGDDHRIYRGQSISLTANSLTPIEFYSWYPQQSVDCNSCQTAIITPEENGRYLVIATDFNGCHGMDEINIEVISSCYADIFIPNAFTPNGDGSNDILYIRSNGELALQYWRIFDRWGREVYHTTDIRDGWNGDFLGSGEAGFFRKSQPDLKAMGGVYVYHLQATCSDGSTVFVKGNVTMLR